MCSMSLLQGELSIDFSDLPACPDDELEAARVLLTAEMARRRALDRRAAIREIREAINFFGFDPRELKVRKSGRQAQRQRRTQSTDAGRGTEPVSV
jgi:hypothetical protein